MKAIVLSHERGGTYVLDSDGSYRFIHGSASLPIGTEIKIKDNPPVNIARIASIAACLILVISFSLTAWLWSQTSHYVYIDINPSVELQINHFCKLKTANPLNDDGSVLLSDLRLNGSADDIVIALIKEAMEKNFIGEINSDPVVLITVVSAGRGSTDALITAIRSTLDKHGMSSFVIVASCSPDYRERAELLGVSPGKLKLAEAAMRIFDGHIALEDILIMHLIILLDYTDKEPLK